MPKKTDSRNNFARLFSRDTAPIKKPFDRIAVLIIIVSIACVTVGMVIRSIAHQQSLNQTIQALVNVDDQLWVALPSELLQVNKQTSDVVHLPYQKMHIPSPITYAVKAANNYWLQLFSGQIWTCSLSGLSCQQVTELKGGDKHYYNIALLPQTNQIIAVNNFSAQMMGLDADTGRVVTADINYSVPTLHKKNVEAFILETMGSLDGWQQDKLYRSNRLHVINNMLVQTDTGNQRVIAWPLNKDGEPLWQKPTNIIQPTARQPYDIAYIARKDSKQNQWLSLESGKVLMYGKLMSYAVGGQSAVRTNISLTLPDPTLMTSYDAHSILVADPSLNTILHLKYTPYSNAAPVLIPYDNTELNEVLQQLKQQRDFYALLAKLALLFFSAPLIGIFILLRCGYDLNQKLGKS